MRERFCPPRLAQWILAQVSRSNNGFAVVGDTAEEYSEMHRRHGRAAARRWYWQQVRASACPMEMTLQFWRMTMLKNDLKISFRALKRNRLFTLINLSGLAVGLAAFTLIALFLFHETGYDRFHGKLDRLYRLGMTLNWNGSWTDMAMSPPGYGPALAEEMLQVKDFARLMPLNIKTVRYGDVLHNERPFYADPGLFRLFDFPLINGDVTTLFTVKNRVAISERTAQKYFGHADPMGQVLLVDGADEFVVDAVFADLPEQSHLQFDVLFSMCGLSADMLDDFQSSNFYTYLELRQADDLTAVETAAAQLIATRAGGYAQRLKPFPEAVSEIYLQSSARYGSGPSGDLRAVRLFAVIAIFVLLMACVNFINLTTARSARRAKEIAVRKVLGSQRSGLIRQFLTESMLLTLLGLGMSMILVQLLLPHFNQAAGLKLSLMAGFSVPLMAVLSAVVVLVGLLAGAYPALLMSGFKPVAVLRGRSHTGGGQSTLRRVLVVFQFGISIALVFASLTVARQTSYMKHRDPGFQKENVINLYLGTTQIKQQGEALKQAMLQEPGVLKAALASREMGSVYGGWNLVDPKGEKHAITALFADADYIEVLGIAIKEGRALDPTRLADGQGYLLNESAAKLLGEGSAVGQQVKLTWSEQGAVIGVMHDFNYRSLHEAPEPLVICGFPNLYQVRYLSLRLADRRVAETLKGIEAVWKSFEPNQPIRFSFLDDHLNSLYRKEERMHTIVLDFAALAVFIGALGLLGLAAYAAERRRKEVAIRKVMGATAGQVVATLCREFVVLVGLAALWALPVAWLFSLQWLAQFAYRLPPNLWVLLGSAGAALLAAILATGFQALKAAWANPSGALRND